MTDISPANLPVIPRGSWVLARATVDAGYAEIHHTYAKDRYSYSCKIEIDKLILTGELYDPSRS